MQIKIRNSFSKTWQAEVFVIEEKNATRSISCDFGKEENAAKQIFD